MMAATGRPQSNLRDDIRAALKKAGLSRIEKDVLEKCESRFLRDILNRIGCCCTLCIVLTGKAFLFT